jgi:2,4'-dihydroxyacetophenone dioxygenase
VTPDVDRMIGAADLPWVEQSEGVWFKPLRLSPERGMWANLLKVAAGGLVSRHRHHGPVEAWVLQGRWRYLEHAWVAAPGYYVHEPEGDVHTLVVEPEEEMMTLFIVYGAIDYLDDEGNVVRTDTAQSKLERYEAHCRAHGLEPLDVVY